MVFRIEPQEIPDDFVWKERMYHLTYAEHIDFARIHETVRRATSVPLVGWSFVKERAVTVYDDGTGADVYEHTHAALMFKTNLNLKGCRKFDVFVPDSASGLVNQYHPNVQPKVNLVQMEQIFSSYHKGRKYCTETGKYRFEPPVEHEFKLPPCFEFTAAILDEVIKAPSLKEACMAGAVRPRTVNDIKALRDDDASDRGRKFRHLFDPSSFTLKAPNFDALHVWGATGLGKTKWAVAQFENPLLIKPFNSVGCLEAITKRFCSTVHDGIVLDEADLRFLTREQVITFLDVDEECVLDVRYKSFFLPAGVKKILISNPSPLGLYPAVVNNEMDPAISRRLKCMQVTRPTFRAPLAATAATQNNVPNQLCG